VAKGTDAAVGRKRATESWKGVSNGRPIQPQKQGAGGILQKKEKKAYLYRLKREEQAQQEKGEKKGQSTDQSKTNSVRPQGELTQKLGTKPGSRCKAQIRRENLRKFTQSRITRHYPGFERDKESPASTVGGGSNAIRERTALQDDRRVRRRGSTHILKQKGKKKKQKSST